MKARMLRGLLTASGLVSAGFIISVNAQTPESDYELVTTAIHKPRSETALPVTILSGDELHSLARSTLGGTLATQPGINNASFGPAVGQTVIRGQQGRRVLNMSNGIPNGDASGNSADHAITSEAILADSIEVLRGPSTLLYGGGAIGGVVNVIDSRIATELPEAPSFSLETRHNSAADEDNFITRMDFSAGNFALHLDGLYREWNDLDIPSLAILPDYLEEEEHEGEEEEEEEHHEEEIENTDGFIGNTGGETQSFTIGASWILDNGFIGFSINDLDKVYGLPAGAHIHEEHEEEEEEEGELHEEEHEGEENILIDMESTRYDLATGWEKEGSFIESVNYRLAYTDYSHRELEGPEEVGTVFSNESWQHRLQLTHKELDGWHGVLGMQYNSDEFSAIGEESFIPVTDISSLGVFLVEDFHLAPFTFEFGARINRDEYSPNDQTTPNRDFSTHSLSSSALWDISSPYTLGLSLSSSERAPSVEELYSNHGLGDVNDCVLHLATSSCEIGQVNLNEERAINTDLSLFVDYEHFNATITAYYNDFNDYIYKSNTGQEVSESPVYQYQQRDARFSGLEVELEILLNPHWELSIFGDSINSHIEGEGDAPRLPPARVGSELSYSSGKLSGHLSFLHAFEQDQPGSNELPSDSYTRWDMGISYSPEIKNDGELLLFLTMHNLSNEEIRLSTSFLRGFAPESGRSIEAGLRVSF